MILRFECALMDCDVDDHEPLAAYRDKLTEWHDWLEGDDPHSIWNQITGLAWNGAVFRVLNESRRLAKQDGGEWAATNGLIAHFVDQGYVSGMVLGVRRLSDRSDANPKKQVLSLTRLIEDVKKHKHLITRQNFVCYAGLPYDVEEAKARWWDKHKSKIENGIFFGDKVGGPDDYDSAHRQHQIFDSISPNRGINARKQIGWH